MGKQQASPLAIVIAIVVLLVVMFVIYKLTFRSGSTSDVEAGGPEGMPGVGPEGGMPPEAAPAAPAPAGGG